MTIGNIPKEIHRKPSSHVQILAAYLPNTKLKHFTNKASQRHTLSNLFHSCIQRQLLPLETVSAEGIVLTSGDGVQRRCYLIFALFIGDYPEQVLITGSKSKSGECPKCQVQHKHLGSGSMPLINRDLMKAKDALAMADLFPMQYATRCHEALIKPIYHPFWENLPYANVYKAIVPNILHQLQQGMVKHLVKWLAAAYGSAELDAHCKRVPPNHHIRLFKNGIMSLMHVTGREHNKMSRLLLGIIADAHVVSGCYNTVQTPTL